MLPFFCKVIGAIANRLCNGLQIRLAQFDSGSRLHFFVSYQASYFRNDGAFLFDNSGLPEW